MKSGLPALLGILGLVAGAFWFDAHCDQVADAASTWMTPAAAPTTPATPSAPPTDDTATAKTSTESTVAFGSANESK
ncbi:MAG: hypothetical protein JWM74_648 [Myxococcaceae bacterium]|jgi:hypothetical protein|nr:hypothetical protein [Myxococcaceae bacterium]